MTAVGSRDLLARWIRDGSLLRPAAYSLDRAILDISRKLRVRRVP